MQSESTLHSQSKCHFPKLSVTTILRFSETSTFKNIIINFQGLFLKTLNC